MSGSPFERGIKRLWRRSAHDHNKASVQGDTPVNSEATPVTTPPVPHSMPAAGTPVLVVVPGAGGYVELVTALVTVVLWAAITWRTRYGEPPVT